MGFLIGIPLVTTKGKFWQYL